MGEPAFDDGGLLVVHEHVQHVVLLQDGAVGDEDPVAATMTSHSSTFASARVDSSHASASNQSASATWATRMAAGCLSTSMTS